MGSGPIFVVHYHEIWLKGKNRRFFQARLVDGASEVHKMVLSRHLLDEGTDFWSWN